MHDALESGIKYVDKTLIEEVGILRIHNIKKFRLR